MTSLDPFGFCSFSNAVESACARRCGERSICTESGRSVTTRLPKVIPNRGTRWRIGPSGLVSTPACRAGMSSGTEAISFASFSTSVSDIDRIRISPCLAS